MKLQSKLMVMGMMVAVLLLGSNLLVASAECDVDGSPSNTGDDGNNVITCDTDNDPAGSSVSGGRGNDQITIGDDVTTGRVAGGRGDDTITINGTVAGNVVSADDNDTIIINGTVTADVIGGGDRDTVIIQEDGTIGGTINGNTGTDTLRFEMLLCELTDGDFDTINDEIENSSPSNDTITINGSTYQWIAFEILQSDIQQELPEICFPPEELGVPPFTGFTDGRLNGLQCQIWLNNGTMELYNYQGLDGILVSESDLIATPAVNTLLARNTTNTVRVYQLTSGEIQVQCDVWDTLLNDWKTDNYIFQDFYDIQPTIIR